MTNTTVHTTMAQRDHTSTFRARPANPSGRMQKPSRAAGDQSGGRNAREAGVSASFEKSRLLQQVQLIDPALQQAVVGLAIAANQCAVQVARVTGQLHDLARHLS